MIRKELLRIREDGVELYKTYSDAKFKIRQVETGNVYTEAVDVKDAPYTYEETDKLIKDPSASAIFLENSK